MSCKICKKSMAFVYDVVERETTFVLWECACGYKELERKPGSQAAATPAPAVAAVAVAAASASSDDD